MSELLKWLSANPLAITTLTILSSILIIVVVLIYLIAFLQGRKISFWPPSIGERPSKSVKGKTPASGASKSADSALEDTVRIIADHRRVLDSEYKNRKYSSYEIDIVGIALSGCLKEMASDSSEKMLKQVLFGRAKMRIKCTDILLYQKES